MWASLWSSGPTLKPRVSSSQVSRERFHRPHIRAKAHNLFYMVVPLSPLGTARLYRSQQIIESLSAQL